MQEITTGCSWSGGKDSCFALMQAKAEGLTPSVLLNVLNEHGQISRSHGIPAEILRAQATEAGLPIHLISSSWHDYEHEFTAALHTLKKVHDIKRMVFGDIDLAAHRDWEEKVCTTAGLTAVLPLWKEDRKQLVLKMLNSGINAVIVSCNETMGEQFLGKKITPALVEELETIGVDACGENGEYHTLVLGCPLFKNALHVRVVENLKHDNYWFTRLALA